MLCPHHHYQQTEMKQENKQKQIGTVVERVYALSLVWFK